MVGQRSPRKQKLVDLPADGPRTWPVFALLEALTRFVALLPEFVITALAAALGVLVTLVTRWREPRAARRGRGALRNMRVVFRHGAPPGLLARYGRHVALLVLEAARLRRLTPRRVRRMVDVSAFERLRALRDEGRGLIVASGHMGNWELLSYAAALEGMGNIVLARPCPEAGLERWLRWHRERSGQQVISKFGGLWPLKKALDRGALVGLNCDENVRDGLFVPFCGALAATTPSAAQLQRITGAPIAVVTCQRLAPGRFTIRIWAEVRADKSAPAEVDAVRVATEVARGLETALRAYPEQWLWALRRWETRPPGEVPAPDGLPPRVA